ncbi:MAG: hypothetical protein K0U41_02360 [Gammaproteobacteria bacterium]|nr:hypothetical protein [Gammaproteobacteria bacterium]
MEDNRELDWKEIRKLVIEHQKREEFLSKKENWPVSWRTIAQIVKKDIRRL